jgi:hypothetical protein
LLTWTADDTFEIAGTEFVCCPVLRGAFRSEPGRFCLVKPRSAVLAYEELLGEIKPRTIIEVGIYEGASTALMAEIARPRALIGVDRSEAPNDALAEFVERRGLSDVVSTHHGVDQADGERLRQIAAAGLAGEALDLVVDDASHRLDATRRTFNALFPMLRPGGTYLIEDWWWAHTPRTEGVWADETPLSVLVFELVLACAYTPGVVVEVCASRDWARVTRGDAALAPEGFDLSTCYGPRGRALVNGL